MFPRALAELHPDAGLHTIRWHEWTTHVLDPLDRRFPRIAAIYAEEQARSFGTDHYYAADTFIEMTPPSGDLQYLARLGRAIYEGMHAADERAVWVLQGWAFMDKRAFWSQPRMEAFLSEVPDDRMLILDLHCEAVPMWNQTKAFAGKPWLWCNVQNFGRNTQLTAALEANNEGLMAARSHAGRGRLEGIGMVNEGLCYNPVAYEFLFEQGWRDQAVELAEWGRGYARRRYGQVHPAAEKAWDLLIPAVYARFQPERCEHLRRPSESVPAVAEPRDGRLEQAWQHLLAAAPDLATLDTYQFDLVNLGRQVLSNRATLLKCDLQAALREGQAAAFHALGQELITVLKEMDALVGTNPEFLLGRWLADARRWGNGAAEQDQLELNARRQITIWGHTDILRDYARKEWAGLLAHFYVERWRRYVAAGQAALAAGREFDPVVFERDLLDWEREWIAGPASYAHQPTGDAVAISRRLRERYGRPYGAEVPS
jgi:alpha-N-acetylglucosaminidase